jgi:hypothetical protein
VRAAAVLLGAVLLAGCFATMKDYYRMCNGQVAAYKESKMLEEREVRCK